MRRNTLYVSIYFFHRQIQKPKRNGQQTQKSFHISFFMRVFFVSVSFGWTCLKLFISRSLRIIVRTPHPHRMCVVPSKRQMNRRAYVRFGCVECACVLREEIRNNWFRLWSYLMASTQIHFYGFAYRTHIGFVDADFSPPKTSERTIEEEENVFRFRFGNKIRKFRQVMVMAVNLFIAWILNAHPFVSVLACGFIPPTRDISHPPGIFIPLNR